MSSTELAFVKERALARTHLFEGITWKSPREIWHSHKDLFVSELKEMQARAPYCVGTALKYIEQANDVSKCLENKIGWLVLTAYRGWTKAFGVQPYWTRAAAAITSQSEKWSKELMRAFSIESVLEGDWRCMKCLIEVHPFESNSNDVKVFRWGIRCARCGQAYCGAGTKINPVYCKLAISTGGGVPLRDYISYLALKNNLTIRSSTASLPNLIAELIDKNFIVFEHNPELSIFAEMVHTLLRVSADGIIPGNGSGKPQDLSGLPLDG